METTWSMYDTHVTPHTPYNTLYTDMQECYVVYYGYSILVSSGYPRSETPQIRVTPDRPPRIGPSILRSRSCHHLGPIGGPRWRLHGVLYNTYVTPIHRIIPSIRSYMVCYVVYYGYSILVLSGYPRSDHPQIGSPQIGHLGSDHPS